MHRKPFHFWNRTLRGYSDLDSKKKKKRVGFRPARRVNKTRRPARVSDVALTPLRILQKARRPNDPAGRPQTDVRSRGAGPLFWTPQSAE